MMMCITIDECMFFIENFISGEKYDRPAGIHKFEN
jgi:hypothetical protein